MCLCVHTHLPRLYSRTLVHQLLELKNTQPQRPHTGVLRAAQKTMTNENSCVFVELHRRAAPGRLPQAGGRAALECSCAAAAGRAQSPPPLRSTEISTRCRRFSSAVFISTASRLPDTWPFWMALISCDTGQSSR